MANVITKLFHKVFGNKTFTIVFHMSGGQSLRVPHVTKLTMKNDGDGSFNGYQIEWLTGHKPDFFSLSLPAIVAVTSED